jgi:hypothetical protein
MIHPDTPIRIEGDGAAYVCTWGEFCADNDFAAGELVGIEAAVEVVTYREWTRGGALFGGGAAPEFRVRELSLNEVLELRGLTTASGAFGAKAIRRAGVEVFRGTSHEVWAWLRAEGLYPPDESEASS